MKNQRILKLFSHGWVVLLILPSLAVFCLTVVQRSLMEDGTGQQAVLPPKDIPAIPLLQTSSWDKYSIVLEHPLFVSSRRPSPPVEPASLANVGVVPVLSPQFSLMGTMIVGGKRKAVVKRPNSPDVITLDLGQQIDGNVLDEVDADKVIFGSGQGRKSLYLMDSQKNNITRK